MSRSGFMASSFKNHLVAGVAEFVGTFLFLYMGFAGANVVISLAKDPVYSQGRDGTLNSADILYIAFSFGISLGVNVWIFYRVSGGMFNPAVRLSPYMHGSLTPMQGTEAMLIETHALGNACFGFGGRLAGCEVRSNNFSSRWRNLLNKIHRALVCVPAQLLGGICAAAVAEAMLPGDLEVRTTLGGGTSIVQGLFIEMFLTAQLIITIFMLAVEKTKVTFMAPLGIGLSLFIAHLGGVGYTGASLNPARSLGPAVASAHFEGYHWIYWVGPMLGALLATGLYKFLKLLNYETANPDQDVDLSCSAREGSSRLACTANMLGLEGQETHGIRPNSSKWSRSKESDLESGPPCVKVAPPVAPTQSQDQILPSHT
ncbi:Aquaporin-2 [Dactylella cylindrospora]|nr:Aquaporin-2 [Dactylella cylindrospora]